jgi:L-lactate utilization protein LutC
VFERKKLKTEKARAKLLNKVHEKKMKPIRLRRQRRKEKANATWLKTITFLNAAKIMKDKFDQKKALLEKMAEQNDAAVVLQRTISKAKSKIMWAKYTNFHEQVYRSKWVFQMAIRTWRKKVRTERRNE